MATQLSFNQYPLLPLAATNDFARPNSLIMEYVEADVTIATNEGTVEVPTTLGDVLGFISLNYNANDDPTDSIVILTDCVKTNGAVTLNVKTADIADGTIRVRGFFVGKFSEVAV